jgi:hypothetical protein
MSGLRDMISVMDEMGYTRSGDDQLSALLSWPVRFIAHRFSRHTRLP